MNEHQPRRRPRRRPLRPELRGDPMPVTEALSGLLARKGWAGRLEGAQIHLVWEEIAGAELARHAEPVRLHGGVLVVRCASGAWATQVRWLAGDLIKRANQVLGEGTVEVVQLTTGPMTRPHGP